jgi:hypothetical protein
MPTDFAGTTPITYCYRPSLLGAGWEFTLRQHGFDWTRGGRSGHVAYASIRRIRLSYRPMSMQMHRFVTEIVADGAPFLRAVSTSWKSLVEQERLDGAYSTFVVELHRRAAERSPQLMCERGRSPLLYWPGLLSSVLIATGLAILIVRALQAQASLAAVLIAAFLGLFVWQAAKYFRRNRPGSYRPEALPPELLPANPV